MGRVVLGIASFLIALYAVGAFLWATADDPCDPSGAGPAVLFIGVVFLGVVAFLVADRRTSRRWISVAALVVTAVGGYFAFLLIGLLVFWVPQCAN